MKTLPHFNHLFVKSTLALLALLLLPLAPLHAVQYTWNNTGTDWNTPSSWNPSSGSSFPNGADVVIFSTTAVTQPNISSSVSIQRLTLNAVAATGYILSSSGGATLTLTATTDGTSSAINYTPSSTSSFTVNAPLILGAAASSTQTIHVPNTNGTVQVNSSISSTHAVTLQKTGNGRLVLASADNSYSGGTRVSAGTLLLEGVGVLGSGNLTMNGGTFDISAISSSSYSHASALTGNGTLRGGAKTLAVNGLAPASLLSLENITLSLSGVSSFLFTDPSFGADSFGLVEGAASTAVNFGGTLSLNFSGGSYSYGSSVQIFDVASYSGSFSDVNFSGLDAGQSAIFDASTGTVTVIPEPSVWSLCALGALLLAAKRRRSLHNA